MFVVEISAQANSFLQSLDHKDRERIEKRISRLSEDPVPSNAKFIGRHDGDKLFRYRIGKYRALYKVYAGDARILIVSIRKRSKAYS